MLKVVKKTPKPVFIPAISYGEQTYSANVDMKYAQYKPRNTKGLISRTANLLNKLTRNRFGDFNIELQALKELRKADILYVPSGHLFLLPLLRRLGFIKTKVVTWFFRLPESSRWWSLRNLRFSQYVLNGFDGILCLTRQATTAFSGRTTKVPVKHLSWFADPNIFHSKPSDRSQGYFLCVGKTRRDYPTLLKACSKVSAQFRIIAPDDAAQDTPIPENVQFVKTSKIHQTAPSPIQNCETGMQAPRPFLSPLLVTLATPLATLRFSKLLRWENLLS